MSNEFELGVMESGSNIYEAVHNQNLQELCVLLESGNCDVNELDVNGRTALFYAACRGNADLTRILLEYGSNPSVYDRSGNTPLHWSGHSDVIEILVKYGADVHARNKVGLLPRQMAKRRGVPNDVIQLFEYLEGSKGRDEITQLLPTFIQEFLSGMGLKFTILFLLGLFFIVLYMTFIITGLSKHFSRPEPILVETQSVKL